MTAQEQTLQLALRRACAALPWLSGLAQHVTLEVRASTRTAAVYQSGRMIFGPEFIEKLDPLGLAFVVAHELLHLALDSHARCDAKTKEEHRRFNVAHDYVINDMLEQAFEIPPPAGGLRMPGARELAPEEIIARLRGQPTRRGGWQAPKNRSAPAQSALGAALAKAGLALPAAEPEDDAEEDELQGDAAERRAFPGLPVAEQQRLRQVIERASVEALDLSRIDLRRLGGAEGESDVALADLVNAQRSAHRPRWEPAVQRWLESTGPATRTWARASRRGGDRSDVALPGRSRTGWQLVVLLDTSGSMTDELARVLGAIGSFCEAAGVDSVRVVQCDSSITSDERVEPAMLARFRILGYGGSDLRPAMQALAQDPDVEALVVITDGGITYPASAPPYHVLWALTEPFEGFQPGYGQVVCALSD